MPPAHRKHDIGSGHSCHYPPSEATGGSPNVRINGRAAMRVDDEYQPHGCNTCPAPTHGRKVLAGSKSVRINSRPATRIGDAIDCGGVAQTGSKNVRIGDKHGKTKSTCQEKAQNQNVTGQKG